jgi:hypothetical protein
MNFKIPKRHFNKAQWHVVTQTAHHLLRDFGVNELTREYNLFRSVRGITKRSRRPVKADTVRRYANGGQGYTNGPPNQYQVFIAELYNVTKKQVFDL